MTGEPDSALRVAAAALIGQLAHWTPSRYAAAASVSVLDAVGPGAVAWAAAPAGSGPTNADALHALAQRLADLASAADGAGRRIVPRLDVDLALPDQLTVLAADLAATRLDPPALSRAAALVEAVRTAL